MKIEGIRKVEERQGVASTLEAESFIPFYTERVSKFLRDNQSSLKQHRSNIYFH